MRFVWEWEVRFIELLMLINNFFNVFFLFIIYYNLNNNFYNNFYNKIIFYNNNNIFIILIIIFI